MNRNTTRRRVLFGSQGRVDRLGWLVALGAAVAVMVLTNSTIANYRRALADQKRAAYHIEMTARMVRIQRVGAEQQLAEIRRSIGQGQ